MANFIRVQKALRETQSWASWAPFKPPTCQLGRLFPIPALDLAASGQQQPTLKILPSVIAPRTRWADSHLLPAERQDAVSDLSCLCCSLRTLRLLCERSKRAVSRCSKEVQQPYTNTANVLASVGCRAKTSPTSSVVLQLFTMFPISIYSLHNVLVRVSHKFAGNFWFLIGGFGEVPSK